MQEIVLSEDVIKSFTIDYLYNPETSILEQTIFQNNKPEESFYHRYIYDSDSRLSEVFVSRTGTDWLKAAEYEYYVHGPLKNKQLGDGIQKVDYVYNLNGWLKAINNPMPGASQSSDDGFGAHIISPEAINYFRGDYMRSGTGLSQSDAVSAAIPNSGALSDNTYDLYSGNIANTITNTGFRYTSMGDNQDLMTQSYRYDYLNRLVGSYTDLEDNSGFTSFSGSNSGKYQVEISYNANGNILQLNRTDEEGIYLDEMTYKYATQQVNGKDFLVNNKLLHINDEASPSTFEGDIEDVGIYTAGNENYVYDAKGRVISNKFDSIALIEWTPSNNIKRITPVSGLGKPTIEYTYTSENLRLTKKLIYPTGSSLTTLYVYDGFETLMASYSFYDDGTTIDTVLNELTDHLGSTRGVVAGELVNGQLQVVNLNDYYPYGMEMPERSFTNESYKFGFQGKEKDTDFSGSESHYDFGARIYDSRIGRWMSVDPLASKYSYLSPYHSFANNPVLTIDVDGRENIIYIHIHSIDQNGKVLINAEDVVNLKAKIHYAIDNTDYGSSYQVYFVDEYMEARYMELNGSDISVIVGENSASVHHSINSGKQGIPESRVNSWYNNDRGTVWGITPIYDHTLPIGVMRQGQSNDFTAYIVAHEIGHKVAMEKDDSEYDYPSLMNSGSKQLKNGLTQYEAIKDLTIVEMKDQGFLFMNEYFDILKKTNFNKRVPKENASRSKFLHKQIETYRLILKSEELIPNKKSK